MDVTRRNLVLNLGLGSLASARGLDVARAETPEFVDGLYFAPFIGSVGRPIRNRMSDILSVGDFGARGDGVNDDTRAFQSAADAAANLGKALFVPATKRGYLVTDTITLRCRRMHGEVNHLDGSNAGTFISFRPKTAYDMKPCFAIVSGMYGAGLVEDISVFGPQAFSRGRPMDWLDPGKLPNYSAFAEGLSGFAVFGANMPTFRNVATAGVKVGLYLDSTDGHVSSYDCIWNGLFGVYCHRNSEDYLFLGGGITGVFAGVVFGTFNHANHTGGMNVTMYRVHMGFAPYGFYQVKDAEFRGPAVSLYGRLDGVRFEQTGEAVFHFLPESVTDALTVDSFGFSWAPVYKGYPETGNAWYTNLPPEILAYEEQQQFALRFGALSGGVKLGWLGGPWPLRRSANAKTTGGIALVERMDIRADADLSGLAGDLVLKSAPTPGSWTRRRDGAMASKMDLALDMDVAPAVNLLRDPEEPSNWLRRGAGAERIGMAISTLADAGRPVPQALFEEVGTTPVVLKITPPEAGGFHLALPFARSNAKSRGRNVCLSLWGFGSRFRARFAIAGGQYLYDDTYEATRDWVKVLGIDQNCGDLAPVEFHLFSDDVRPFYVCGLMACLDIPRPYTPLSVPRVRYGLAFEGADVSTVASAAGTATALPSAPSGYLTVKINGADRQIAYY